METSLTTEKRTRRVHLVPVDEADQAVFQELDVGVDTMYHEAEKVFYQADAGDGACIGVFGDKAFPFDLHLTAQAAWRCLAHTFQHEKFNFSYHRERRLDTGDIARDDTVVESFGVEIKAPERIADFRIKQVFRQFVEQDRIVIAWRSFIDPAEFKGQPLQGIRFQEKGSVVIRPSKVQAPDSVLTQLRIWHVITPETLGNTKERDSSQFIQELTDFVLGGSSSASTVQMIENMLVEQATKRVLV
ncbi:unnamed protein product [Phytophthora lilii]|uniref:Unnamed protein product n=1 Tax=Phytophthora lilii TaxID=2077276 RepID=A0A9W6X2H1_9STRA|nr:unnamed protein product [Phytophthora lilii]